MEIIDIRNIEDCFDGSYIRELVLSDKITKELIFNLAVDSEIQYLSSLKQPFFKITNNDYLIKGVEGNKSIRLIIKSDYEEIISKVSEIINNV